MSITPDSLQDIKSTLSTSVTGVGDIMSSVKDPVGIALSKTLSTVNKLVVEVESKISKLQEDVILMADSTGKVSLVNNVLTVTISPDDVAKIPQYEAKLQSSVNRLTRTTHSLKLASDSLKVLSTTAQTLKAALDVQEVLLTVGNPAAAATMTLIKKAIKILSYKDVLGEYVKILASQTAATEASISKITSNLSTLSVQFKVQTEAMKGNSMTASEAINQIATDKVSDQTELNLQNYADELGREFVLVVEPYKGSGLIGRARDKYSNLLVAETSPSFIYSKSQLLEELKLILNR
jgi:hypothetical protein